MNKKNIENPLTIEQLREMVGMPVLVQCLNPRTCISPSTGWYFLDKSITGNVFAININNYFIERDYGTEWIAYAYPPAHIDREAWTSEWEWFDEDIGNPLDGIERDWGWRCSKCGYILPDNFDNPDSPPKMKYCSACGRAMTPEAWNELEKRLRG